MGLPTHYTELAAWGNKRGCAVKSFLTPKKEILIHGNELLGGMISGYEIDKIRGQSDHTFENIVKVIESLFVEGRPRQKAAIAMVGYLVFDALVGNTDRHHQNWGVLLKPEHTNEDGFHYLVRIAPTFDHASSLGRELLDEARSRHLAQNTVVHYIQNGRGGIFEDSSTKKGLSPIELAKLLAERYPDLFKPWQKRVAEIEKSDLVNILSHIPEERMSPQAAAFALALLENTKKLLLNL